MEGTNLKKLVEPLRGSMAFDRFLPALRAGLFLLNPFGIQTGNIHGENKLDNKKLHENLNL
jgi:hypothetical protein